MTGEELVLEGALSLEGSVKVSGAKNAALPLMILSLLTEGELELSRVPRLTDTWAMGELLGRLGVLVEDCGGGVMRLGGGGVSGVEADYDLVSRMRASFWVLGPLLGRFGEARVATPGGCLIGERPVDYYVEAVEALGGEVELGGGWVKARTGLGGLRGGVVRPRGRSVGLTHTVMMMGATARGETVLENAAREPEVVAVAECLRLMGVELEGEGTDVIRIEGRGGLLGGCGYEAPADRVEGWSWAMAVGLSGGDVELEGASPRRCAVWEKLEETGLRLEATNKGVRVSREEGERLRARDMATGPWPLFPTDLQAPYTALMSCARGECRVEERVFENRYHHVAELRRLGADMFVEGGMAFIRGVEGLRGAPVLARDLRGAMGLAMGGMAAKGETRLGGVEHLDRGFEAFEGKARGLGALVRRVVH